MIRATFRNLFPRAGCRVAHLPVRYTLPLMAKRKAATATAAIKDEPVVLVKPLKKGVKPDVNPDTNDDVIDAPGALRASPDHEDKEPPQKKKRQSKTPKKEIKTGPDTTTTPVKSRTKAAATEQDSDQLAAPKTPASTGDPEGDGDELEEADPEDLKDAVSRPPPVNSDYLPLPWKGRLGYACLNTYLRNSNPPIFCSRTTRIASILEHRHPLKDPSQPEHATKNRPDKDQPAEVERGQKFVEALALANIKDIIKMVRWNERYGIRFLRLSSEMFPFASHAEYGYRLNTFAAEGLAEAGKVIAELGHRVTMHPGQFTQLGSPRKQVIDASFRDLEYHDELLSLLKLPEQLDRDAVLILHMGGMFGDKAATLDRFRENYARLPASIKKRLVLENDDMCWSVHDLLPICKELNIPFVLDWHHHNIIFDPDKIREGSKDILELLPEIIETWKRKGITPKMHYSEPRPAAITRVQRRRHNPRVMTLPPCPPDMDLMIEAKDKEQAVFELMRTFKLPGWHLFNDVIPFVRTDDNKTLDADLRKKEAAAQRKRVKAAKNGEDQDGIVAEEPEGPDRIPEEEVGMGGPDGRVYWPVGMEEWLRPQKRVVKKKDEAATTPASKRKAAAADEDNGEEEAEDDLPEPTPVKASAAKKQKTTTPKKASASASKPKKLKKEPTPPTSEEDVEMDFEVEEEDVKPAKASRPSASRRASSRANRAPKKSYAVDEDDSE